MGHAPQGGAVRADSLDASRAFGPCASAPRENGNPGARHPKERAKHPKECVKHRAARAENGRRAHETRNTRIPREIQAAKALHRSRGSFHIPPSEEETVRHPDESPPARESGDGAFIVDSAVESPYTGHSGDSAEA